MRSRCTAGTQGPPQSRRSPRFRLSPGLDGLFVPSRFILRGNKMRVADVARLGSAVTGEAGRADRTLERLPYASAFAAQANCTSFFPHRACLSAGKVPRGARLPIWGATNASANVHLQRQALGKETWERSFSFSKGVLGSHQFPARADSPTALSRKKKLEPIRVLAQRPAEPMLPAGSSPSSHSNGPLP